MHFCLQLVNRSSKRCLTNFNCKNLIMNRLKHFINIDDDCGIIGNGKYQIIYPVTMILKI